MLNLEYEWLPHLEDAVPNTISGDRLSVYAIALEGWRRGLTVKFYAEKYRQITVVRYSLIDGDREIKFNYSTGPDVTLEAKKICSNKTLTKKYLSEGGVAVPYGECFSKEVSDKEIVEYVSRNIDFPVVLKPSNGKMGIGVIANIPDVRELKKALTKVRNDLGYGNVIVEEYIPGEEYRIYVLDGKVIAAMNRIPASVLGDGKKTVRELMREKNEIRRKIPSVRRRPLMIDAEVKRNLRKYKYTLKSVPKKGELIFLRKTSNISSGGDPIDVTDQLSDENKAVAANVAKAIPGLVECGVDLIVDARTGEGKVIEVNTNVGLGGHLFPLKGKARDIPKAIVDYYFPHTKKYNTTLYFDFMQIVNLLKSGAIGEVTLPAIPKEELIVKGIEVSGEVQVLGFRSWIQSRALYFELNGFVENIDKGKVRMVLAGTEENVQKFENLLTSKGPANAKIKKITSLDWTKPIEAGFKIIPDKK